MSLLLNLITNIRNNVMYYFLSFCLISSALAIIPFGQYFYLLGILIGLLTVFFNVKSIKFNLFFVFLISCYISSIISGLFDYRIFLFTIIMLFVSPIISSRKAFEIRKKYIKYSLFVFPILSVINLYCYYAGINMMSLDERDVSWDFSAIFWHSMWLGAASGLANIVIFWMQQQPVGNIRKVFYTVWLLISIFLSVVSASRSALVASLIAITYIIYIKSNNIKKLLRYLILILGIVTLTFPFYKKSATRIMNKVEYQQNIGENSRQRAIEARLLDFYESPIFGVGFAVGRDFRTGLKQIGQMESGSGWFSILCQCGLVGFFVIISILLQAYFRVKNKIREDSFLLLLVSILLYQCAHSLFEGYILTSGYYMCILFWGILSLLYVYPIENSKNNK